LAAIVTTFFTAFLISFLGQLPLGNTSLTATQIRVQEGLKSAILYMWGVAIVEMIYLRIALTGMDWIFQHPIIFKSIGWITVVFFCVLGIVSIKSAYQQQTEKKGILINNQLNRFILGLWLCALNPAQIPFWFLWTSYALEWKILHSNTVAYNVFTVGAGLGTIGGLLVYIYGGNYLITQKNVSNRKLNLIMGIIFLIAGIAQLWRMLDK